MADDIFKNASSKLLAWLLGIIATLMVTALYGGFKFYSDWKADEAYEEMEQKSLMFESPKELEQHRSHVKEALPPLEQKLKYERDKDFQKEVLEQLKTLAKIDTLNADQIYQIKQQLNENNPN